MRVEIEKISDKIKTARRVMLPLALGFGGPTWITFLKLEGLINIRLKLSAVTFYIMIQEEAK